MVNTRRDTRSLAARWWKRPLALICASAATAGVAWAAYDAVLRPAPVAELIPEYVPGFGVVDARQAWDLTSDIRNTKDARKGLLKLEKELGINIATDVLPWAGDVAVAPLAMPKKEMPDLAVLVEVRNPARYYLTMTRLRTRIEREATPHWKGTGYHGVPLRYGYVGKGMDRVPVSTAWLKGWVVVGVGNGSAKRVIDAWQGRKRTLAKNTAWATTLAGIPTDAPIRFGVNTKLAATMAGLPGVPKEMAESSQSVFAEALHDTGDGVRLSISGIPTSAAGLALTKKFAAAAAPVPDGLLERLPQGTFAMAGVSDPGEWWKAYAPIYEMVRDRQGIDHADVNKDLKPVTDMIARMKGAALGVGFDEEQGWGVFGVGDCGSADSAHAGSETLADLVEKGDKKVEMGEDGDTYRVAAPAAPLPGVGTVSPGWKVDGPYLTVTTNVAWLSKPSVGTLPPLPDEARGAPLLARGDFSFVTDFLHKMSALRPAGEGATGKDPVKGWEASRLGDARWSAWMRYSEQGAFTGAVDISNWPWRDAVRGALNGK